MKAALLVIDFINDIVNEQGKVPSCAAYVKGNKVIDQANLAIDLARQHQLTTIFVKVGFAPGYPELFSGSPVFSPAASKGAFVLGDTGCEFHEELDYKDSDIVVIKHRISPFYATDLETYLRAMQIDTVFISGVSTNNAVQACARDAHDRDYRAFVIADACGAKNAETHEASLSLIKDVAGIMNVSEFQARLQ